MDIEFEKKLVNVCNMSILGDNLESHCTEPMIKELYRETDAKVRSLIGDIRRLDERSTMYAKYPEYFQLLRHRDIMDSAFATIYMQNCLIERIYRDLTERRNYELNDEEKMLIMDIRDLHNNAYDYIEHAKAFYRLHKLESFGTIDKKWSK